MSFPYSTAIAGSVLTAAFWNSQVRDNGTLLKTQIDDNGHAILSVAVESGDYNVAADDDLVVFDTSATATLPASPDDGKPYVIKSGGSGVAVTVDGNGNIIDGESTFDLGEFDAASFVFNGTEWSVY